MSAKPRAEVSNSPGFQWVNQLPATHRDLVNQVVPVVGEFVKHSNAVAAGDILAKVFESVLERQAKRKPKAGLAQAVFRGRVAREKLKVEEGGSCSADEAGSLLGMSKPGVLKRYHHGRLLGWREAKQHAVRLPVWQFTEDGVLPGLEESLVILNRVPWMDDWGRILFFLNPRRSLDGGRPLDLLRKGKTRKVLGLAQAAIE